MFVYTKESSHLLCLLKHLSHLLPQCPIGELVTLLIKMQATLSHISIITSVEVIQLLSSSLPDGYKTL